MSEIICPSCGKTFDDADNGVCPHCGASTGAAPPTVDIPPPGSAAPSTEELPLPDGMSAAFGETPRVGPPVTPDAPAANANMKSFSRYQILGELGRGGMGIVYKTYDPKLKRIVALKVLLAGDAASGEEVERFFREAESAASLHHPNIVPIHELDVHEGKHFFTMDYIEGKPLSKVIRETDTGMAPRRAVEIVRDVARAVHHAHEGGIIHRDLKPANILITPDGWPMVTDFGLAKQIKGDSSLTQSGCALGTPSYMAPEQARGRLKEIDARTDVYSLGAVLYECVTGLPPFVGATPFEIMEKVAYADPIPPRVFNRACPQDVETIALKCLEKDRSRRYASASDLADDCERFLNNDPIAARPASVIYRVRKRLARHRAVSIVSGLALATVVGLTAWYLTSLQTALDETRLERDRAVKAEAKEAEQRKVAEMREGEAKKARDDAEEARKGEEKQRRKAEAALEMEQRLRKIDAEFRIAREIEATLLPGKIPTIPGYTLCPWYRSAGQFGGTFYNCYVKKNKDQVDLVMATVRSIPKETFVYFGGQADHLKGLREEIAAPVPRALTVARFAGHVEAILGAKDISIRDASVALNSLLTRVVLRGQVVDLLLARFDRTSSVVRISSCAFQPQVAVVRSSGEIAFPKVSRPKLSIPIALAIKGFFESHIKVQDLDMEAGDSLVIFTWGLTAQQDEDGNEFGTDGLSQALAGAAGMKAADMRERILRSFDSHKGNGEQSHDVCVLVLKRQQGEHADKDTTGKEADDPAKRPEPVKIEIKPGVEGADEQF